MIKYIIKSTYKTYHGKIGYFFLLFVGSRDGAQSNNSTPWRREHQNGGFTGSEMQNKMHFVDTVLETLFGTIALDGRFSIKTWPNSTSNMGIL